MEVIKVKNLTKKFGNLIAVNNISFSVKNGEIFAFLGPNGAGKTTTIKMLITILKSTSGKAEINGEDISKKENEVRKSIGIIFQEPSLDDELTAYENMNYHGVLYKVKNKDEKIKKLLDEVKLLDRKDDLIKTFSGGMKRRVEIARGLLHSPKVLFLDEPTIGLDTQTKNFFWQNIKKLNKKGLTVFFTTHNLDEAEKIADKVAIIDKGKILIIGTPNEINKKTKSKSLEQSFLKLTGYDIREERPKTKRRMRR